MPTLADVAALAGVSKATASRALDNSTLVARGTAAKVLAAAAELGFTPNRVARGLARGSTGIVALVVPTLENTFFAPIIAGAQERAEQNDLQLTVAVHPFEEKGELSAFERLARQVDGLVLVAPRGADEVVAAAARVKPAVLVDREIEGMPSVVADTATAFGTVVDGLIASGHRRISYVGGPAGSWQDAQRTAAIAAAARRADAALDIVGPHPATFAAGVSAVGDVVDFRSTAVVPYATSIALGLMFGLRARGLELPHDVVVSAEGVVAAALELSGVPAIDVDGRQLGQEAMGLLIEALSGATEPRQRRLAVPVSWS